MHTSAEIYWAANCGYREGRRSESAKSRALFGAQNTFLFPFHRFIFRFLWNSEWNMGVQSSSHQFMLCYNVRAHFWHNVLIFYAFVYTSLMLTLLTLYVIITIG